MIYISSWSQICLDRRIDRTQVCLASARKSKKGRRESKKETYKWGERYEGESGYDLIDPYKSFKLLLWRFSLLPWITQKAIGVFVAEDFFFFFNFPECYFPMADVTSCPKFSNLKITNLFPYSSGGQKSEMDPTG